MLINEQRDDSPSRTYHPITNIYNNNHLLRCFFKHGPIIDQLLIIYGRFSFYYNFQHWIRSYAKITKVQDKVQNHIYREQFPEKINMKKKNGNRRIRRCNIIVIAFIYDIFICHAILKMIT